MPTQPQRWEPLTKWGYILTFVSLISMCTYSKIKEENLKHIPTPENIARWEKIKKNHLDMRVCDSMDLAVQSAKENNSICTDDFNTIVSRSKAIFDKLLPYYIGSLGIPAGYTSVQDISITIESLPCKKTIQLWRNCPTGYSYSN
jgi:hypothetical protein